MLRRTALLLLASTVTLFVSCAQDLITPNESFRFHSPEQQREFEKRALAGDIEAARALANYYNFVEDDVKKAVYWYKVAAAHGDKTATQDIKVITRRD
jgi:TPR repeat protein